MGKVIIFADGATKGTNPGLCGVGIVFFNEAWESIWEIMRSVGEGTNNMAEFKALIVALEEAKKREMKNLIIRMDSRLVIELFLGNWKTEVPHLVNLRNQAWKIAPYFDSIDIQYIPRQQNTHADMLSKLALE